MKKERFVTRTLPSLAIIEIAGNTHSFQHWLNKIHGIQINTSIFAGYKFFIECALSDFFYFIATENILQLKEDFLLRRAIGQSTVFIGDIPATCERTILLKNIYDLIEPIRKSKNVPDLVKALAAFNKEVSQPFQKIGNEMFKITVTANLKKTEIQKLILIENLYIQFTQINFNGPVAYQGSLMKEFWIDKKKKDFCLNGYAYTLQYLWFTVLGNKKFHKTSLKSIHKADSWKKYTYIKTKRHKGEYNPFFDNYYEIETQTCLDSYFERIKEEIIIPIEIKFKIDILRLDEFYSETGEIYSGVIFKHLLKNRENQKSDKPLPINDKLDMDLYWYPLEVFKPGQIHNGVSAFITLLAGTVALQKNEREFDTVHVSKFIHPIGENKNDYSYGILIDTFAAARHYDSGWLLYYDCCSDHSGFSGSEYKRAEEIIKQYKKMNLISLREISVEKNVFEKYVAKHIYSPDVEKMTYEKIREIENEVRLETDSQRKKDRTIISSAKGLIFELLTCYFFAKKFNLTHTVEWNINKKKGEIDVCIYNQDEVLVIECKVTPENNNLEQEYNKAVKKTNEKFPGKKILPIEFWFWNEPNGQNKEWLKKNKIEYTVVSTNSTGNQLLKSIDLDNIKYVLSYY